MDSTTGLADTGNPKKVIPVKILIFMWMAFLLPFIMYVPLNVIMGGLTYEECMMTSNNLYSYIFMAIVLIAPVIIYCWLNGETKKYVPGDESSVAKLNKSVKIASVVRASCYSGGSGSYSYNDVQSEAWFFSGFFPRLFVFVL